MAAETTASPFRGFRSPNYTQVPDELFDELLPTLSGAELKVLLYIIRRTFGFKREADAISLSQMMTGITTRDGRVLDRGAGLSKPTLLGALRSLVAREIIETERRRSVERGDEPTVYRLRFAADGDAVAGGATGGEPEADPVVKKFDQGVVKESAPPVVKKSAPQETGGQQTEISLSNIRRSRQDDVDVDNLGDNSLSHPVTPSRIDTWRVTEKADRGTGVTQTALVTIGPPDDNGGPTPAGGMEPVGAVLRRGRGRPPKQPYTEERQQIHAYVKDFAPQLGDQAPLASSVTRAYNLYLKSGWPIARFIDALYQARAKTRERSAGIRTPLPKDDPWGTKPKMAYFFSVLADEVGLRDEEVTVAVPR